MNTLTQNEFKETIKIAKEHLEAAELLLEKGYFRDSISRSYYAFFDVVAALLAIKGVITKTHAGALQQLGLYYIKTGILSEDSGKTMRRLLEARQKADYEWQIDFTKKEALASSQEAKIFIDLIEKSISKFF